jgi:hypothetical protein
VGSWAARCAALVGKVVPLRARKNLDAVDRREVLQQLRDDVASVAKM